MRRERAHGVGLRRPHFDAIFERADGVEFLEIVPENFMRFGGRPRDVLERALRRWPIVVHGTGMSLGGPDPLNERYLDDLAELLELVSPPWFSDHVATSSAFGVEYFDLLPVPFTEAAVRRVVSRIRQVQDRFRRPFLVENPSYYVALPGAEMTEAEFLNEVVARADCGLLLDVNNVFVNARNHGYDPAAFLDAMPAGRVVQMHIAGHLDAGGLLIDTHGAAIRPEVLALYEHAVRAVGPTWTLLEWDNDIPPLPALLAENAAVRAAADRALGDRSQTGGPG